MERSDMAEEKTRPMVPAISNRHPHGNAALAQKKMKSVN
jgi:hypothetical protein